MSGISHRSSICCNLARPRRHRDGGTRWALSSAALVGTEQWYRTALRDAPNLVDPPARLLHLNFGMSPARNKLGASAIGLRMRRKGRLALRFRKNSRPTRPHDARNAQSLVEGCGTQGRQRLARSAVQGRAWHGRAWLVCSRKCAPSAGRLDSAPKSVRILLRLVFRAL